MTKILTLILTVFFFTAPAFADPAIVSEGGSISLSGIVEDVSESSNEFTLEYNDDEITVTMDQIDKETLDHLIEADIIEEGVSVTVIGEMEDDISGPVIKASTINVNNSGLSDY